MRSTILLRSRNFPELWIDTGFSSVVFLHSAINCIFVVLGITPYLRFSMTLSAVTSVVRLAKTKVLSYLVIFLIIMYGFGTAGFIIYGDKISAYSSILRGFLEMILATLGGIQYTEMKATNPLITLFFAFSYLIFANTVFLKTFLLIIQEKYNDYFAEYSEVAVF